MAAIEAMMNGLVPDMPDNDDEYMDPNVDNSKALMPSTGGGFLTHEEDKPLQI
jgi:hypothetical protein